MTSGMKKLDVLKKYDRPGPRYTSYPTAVEFHEEYGTGAYEKTLAHANSEPNEPLSLYTHLPFCEERCTFCGCHVIITKKRDVTSKYLQYLDREIAMVAARLPDRRGVIQFHWGGGTPSYQSVAEMEHLFETFRTHFQFLPGAEIALEVDPRVTTFEQIDVLAKLGFNRISMGVQDFTHKVQETINRVQSVEQTRALYEHCLKRGFESINIDLIYGLPHQTESSFAETVDTVIAMRPGRVAVYSFAFVPWKSGQQKAFDEGDLPGPETKLRLFHGAMEQFMAAGYEQIGMDHFALPDDELARARNKHELHRNFMGYTTKPANGMLGFGISSIGDISGAFVQNEKKLSRYYQAVDADRLPVLRGFELSDDDRIRRHVISELMCNFHLDVRALEKRFGIVFASYFARERDELREPARHGFLSIADNAIQVSELGRLIIRNICMVFDIYLREKSDDSRVFSRTI